jgi:HNH endonuclease
MLAGISVPAGDPDTCWEWIGPYMSDGYGAFCVDGRRFRAHRVSWRLANGKVPPGACVLHHCDNRRCVRPSHLFLGARRDNALDKTIKRRVRHSQRGLPFGVAIQPQNRYSPFVARIRENGKLKHIGSFATVEAAARAAAAAREERNQRIAAAMACTQEGMV